MKTTLPGLAIVAAAALLMSGGSAQAATPDSIMESAKIARCKTVLVCTNAGSSSRRLSASDRYRPIFRPRSVTVNKRCVRRTQCP